MTRPGMLRLLGVDPERWARRHAVEPFSAPCDECGADMTTTVPFAWGTMRGLVAPVCACGNERTPYCVAWDTLPEGTA